MTDQNLQNTQIRKIIFKITIEYKKILKLNACMLSLLPR